MKNPENRQWEKQSVSAVAAAQGKHPVDTFLDFAVSEALETLFETVSTNGDLKAVGEMLRHPAAIIGALDAGAHTAFSAKYGYCAEFVGPWMRDRGAMTLEEAVSELGLAPAALFGLPDRGLIRPGQAADLVIFDPATVGPDSLELIPDYPAGQTRLVQPTLGIYATVGNSEVLTENIRHLGTFPDRGPAERASRLR